MPRPPRGSVSYQAPPAVRPPPALPKDRTRVFLCFVAAVVGLSCGKEWLGIRRRQFAPLQRHSLPECKAASGLGTPCSGTPRPWTPADSSPQRGGLSLLRRCQCPGGDQHAEGEAPGSSSSSANIATHHGLLQPEALLPTSVLDGQAASGLEPGAGSVSSRAGTSRCEGHAPGDSSCWCGQQGSHVRSPPLCSCSRGTGEGSVHSTQDHAGPRGLLCSQWVKLMGWSLARTKPSASLTPVAAAGGHGSVGTLLVVPAGA